MKWRKAALILSSILMLTGLATNISHAQWQEENGRWWYKNKSELGYAVSWEEISGSWYLFDSNGWMLTGWQTDGTNWYYLSDTGEMQTGWILLDSSWYFLDSNGAMRTENLIQNDLIYHFSSDGVCLNPSGTVKPASISSFADTSWIISDDGSNLKFVDDTYFTWLQSKLITTNNYYSGVYEFYTGNQAIDYVVTLNYGLTRESITELIDKYDSYTLENFMCLILEEQTAVINGAQQSTQNGKQYLMGFVLKNGTSIFLVDLDTKHSAEFIKE